MNPEKIRHWLETKAELSFSRSSGPGGQNVNKVSSKAAIFVPLREIDGLSEFERQLAIEKMGGRLSEGAVLIVQVQDTRSQLQNRELAVERVIALLEKAIHRDKARRATKPSQASQERRVAAKKVVSIHKKNRGRPGME